jgi:hypothetical protein
MAQASVLPLPGADFMEQFSPKFMDKNCQMQTYKYLYFIPF